MIVRLLLSKAYNNTTKYKAGYSDLQLTFLAQSLYDLMTFFINSFISKLTTVTDGLLTILFTLHDFVITGRYRTDRQTNE